MPLDSQTIIDLAVRASAFGLVLCLWFFGLLLWSARRKSRTQQLEQRLGLRQENAAETKLLRLWKDGQEATTTVPDLRHLSLWNHLDQIRQQAGCNMPIQTLLLVLVGVSLMLFVLVLVMTQSVVVAMGASSVMAPLVWAYMQGRIRHRLVLFENQFVEALELAARSLRAGPFWLVSEEMSDPVGPVFGEICQLQAMGISLEEGVQKVAEASASPDMKLFATSVIIQVRSGGNLADMMHRLADVIRDRMRLKRRVRVLTAQTQLSKRVLLVLPFLLFGVLNLLNPTYMMPLYTTSMGRTLLVVAGTGLMLGVWVMNRLSVLKY